MAHQITVNYLNRNCATVSGYLARDLIIEHTGRPPCWSSAYRGWVVQPHNADDVIALAEARRFEVVVTEGDPLAHARGELF